MAKRRLTGDKFWIKKAGYAPGVLDSLKNYFSTLHSLLHYYSENMGPYLSPHLQNKLADLHFRADSIIVRLEELIYEKTVVDALLKMDDVEPPERFAERVNELRKEVEKFGEEILDLIEAIRRNLPVKK